MTLFHFLLLLLLFLISLSLMLNLKNRKPNQPPSPPKLPIIGNLHQLGKLHHCSLQKLSQKHGPIMLLHLGNSPTIIISSSELAKQVLKTHDLECCSRPLIQGPKRLSYNFLDIAFAPYSDYWKEMRKISVMELFTIKRVKSFASIRQESLSSLIDYISSQTNPCKAINLSDKIFELMFSNICRIACGKTYKEFEEGKLERVMEEAMGMLGSFSAADFFPYVGWIVDVISGLRARRERSFHQFDVFYQKVIDEHLDPQRPPPANEDMVDILLGLMKNKSDGNGLTFDHIKGVLMVTLKLS